MPRAPDQIPSSDLPGAADVAVIILALNEEEAIGHVLRAIPSWVRDVIVVDNGSTDRTAQVAQAGGARVVHEPRRGYGAACLAGIAALKSPQVVVFLDADFSDLPQEMDRLVRPILSDEADLVIGSRVLGESEPGALTPQQRFGNWLACRLLRLLYGVRHTDLGPFRAIRYTSLLRLDMDDLTYGWTVQMQARAARLRLRAIERPVSYRRRIGGQSKISGTIRGVLGAGVKILHTLARERFRPMSAGRQHLAIISRYPEAGRTKTRLIPGLGAQQAAAVHRRMIAHTLAQVRQWRTSQPAAAPVIYFAGGDAPRMRELFGADLPVLPQRDGDLGQRIHGAIEDGLSRGAEFAVLIGTDCPQISPRILRQAFAALRQHDIVLGPASDGGYYLIGMRCAWRQLFEEVTWGTETVLAETLSKAGQLGLSVAQLQMLDDVDRPEDLPIWQRADLTQSTPPTLSVIIPTFDEQDRVAEAICSALAPGVEIIVVDGGSGDRTIQIAESYGAIVIHGRKGRACQMNAGAAAAKTETLLFLHADSHLPAGYRREVERILALPRVAGGSFSLCLSPSSPAMRLISMMANLRSRWFQISYGDQAIFISKSRFDRLGGFPEMPIMEDLAFVQRLKRYGKIHLSGMLVTTSGRRWQRDGIWRTTLLNQMLVVAYHIGCSPSMLLQWRESGKPLGFCEHAGQASHVPIADGSLDVPSVSKSPLPSEPSASAP